MDRVDAAVVGLGNAGGRNHVPAFAAHPDVNLVALCDPDENRAESIATEHGVSHTYDFLEDAVGEHDIDVVSVCTPVTYHFEGAKVAMEAGADVLIEKPMVGSLAEADDLHQIKQETGAKLSVIHNHKFLPGISEGLSICNSGDIGTIKSVEFDLMVVGEENRWINDPDSWAHDLPGGRWEECLPHQLYIPYDIVGEMELLSVECRKTEDRFPWLNFDELLITLESESGYVTIRYCANSERKMKDWVVRGTKGRVVFDYDLCEPLRAADSPMVSGRSAAAELLNSNYVFKRIKWRLQEYLNLFQGTDRNAHETQIDLFVGHVLGRNENPVSWDEAYETMRLVSEISDVIAERATAQSRV